MPIRSGAMQWPSGCRCGNTLRQRYDEVGLPCSSTMGSPSPTSTYAISLPRTRCRCFLYGNEEEIILGSPSFFAVAASLHLNGTPSFEQRVGVGGFSQIPRNGSDSVARAGPRSRPCDRAKSRKRRHHDERNLELRPTKPLTDAPSTPRTGKKIGHALARDRVARQRKQDRCPREPAMRTDASPRGHDATTAHPLQMDGRTTGAFLHSGKNCSHQAADRGSGGSY